MAEDPHAVAAQAGTWNDFRRRMQGRGRSQADLGDFSLAAPSDVGRIWRERSGAPVATLPTDARLHVLRLADSPTRARLCRTSRQFRELCSARHDDEWRVFVHEDFTLTRPYAELADFNAANRTRFPSWYAAYEALARATANARAGIRGAPRGLDLLFVFVQEAPRLMWGELLVWAARRARG